MFKKSLMALAMAGAAFNASAVLTLDPNGSTATTEVLIISAEGSKNTTSVAISDVDVVLGTITGFTTASSIEITITGGTLTPSTSLTAVHDTATTNLVSSSAVTYPTLTKAVLTFTGSGAAETAIRAAVATDVITLGGLSIAPTSTDAGSKIGYTVKVLSNVGGSVIDSVTGTVAVYSNQFAAIASPKADGTIDVGNQRLSYEAKAVSDVIGVSLTSAQVDLMAADGTAGTIKTVLTGSFAYLDGDASGTVDAGSVTTTSGSPTVSADFTTVTETAAAIGTGLFDGGILDTEVEAITLTVDGKTNVLGTQTFSISTEFDYVDQGTKTNTFSSVLAGGSWSLNGSSSFIPYLPFDSSFSQSVTVTNTGVVPGAITIDWTSAGVEATTELTAVAAANSITDITAELKALAAANGITGDAALSVVVNSPNTDVRVSALYYSLADADRGVVAVENP